MTECMMVTARPVRLKYYLRIPNVGDRVNPRIIEQLAKVPIQYFNSENEPHLLATGSVLSSATPSSMIWGAGLMHPKFGIGQVDSLHVWAVRGELTYNTLKSAFPALPDVPLGDPGILAAELMGITAQTTPAHHLGVVAHYVDRQDQRISDMLLEEGVLDLNVHLPPEEFIKQMASCAVIVSSSLHGLIFAESLGLPNLWIKVTDEIAGHDFKFHDWYSTTLRPQTEAHNLSVGEKASDLISRALPRESQIDKTALKDAMSPSRLELVRETEARKFYPVEVCRTMPTPCFFISYNRGEFLGQSLKGLQKQSCPIDAIIHDNGSTDKNTLSIIQKLDNDGFTVFRYPAINTADDLNQVNQSVTRYFENWAEPQRYIVSDCDVDMSESRADAIEVFDHALNIFRHAEAVGPMLRISDIPTDYPLRNHALNLHIRQFWQYLPEWIKYKGEALGCLKCPIDTTLALHRAGEPFRRLKSAVRFYAPHEARHLDWYLSEADMRQRDGGETSDISHWNNAEWTETFEQRPLEFPGFFNLIFDPNGMPKIKWISLPGAPWTSARQLLKRRLKRFFQPGIQPK